MNKPNHNNNNNRQNNSQKRGRNQRRRPGGGNPNRALDSNGPDVRIRGTANQIYDKYQTLARDAASAGDRVRAENYLQHAEHYFRLIKAQQPPQPAATQNETTDGEGEQPTVADTPTGEAHTESKSQPPSSEQKVGEEASVEVRESSENNSEPNEAEGDEKKPRRRRPRRTKAEAEAAKEDTSKEVAAS